MFVRICLMLTALTLVLPPAGAQPCGQWQPVEPPVAHGASLRLVDVVPFAPDNASGFGVTFQPNGSDPASIILTHWDGASWQVVTEVDLLSGVLPGVPRGVAAIDGSGPDNLWLAGTFDPPGFVFARPFLAHWDGSAWTFHYPDSDGGSPVEIAYVSDNLIYLFGGNAGPWVWDGSNLSLFPAFPPVSIGVPVAYDAVLVGSGEFWIGGHQQTDPAFRQSLALWHWDGSQWEEYIDTDVSFLSGEELANSHIFGLAAIAPDDVWAVGDKQPLNGDLTSLYLHWDGSTWTEVAGPDIGPTQVAAVSANDIWAAGQVTGPPGSNASYAHWDGSSWTEVPHAPIPGLTNLYVHEMVVSDGCDGWLLGAYSTDFGATFVPLIEQLRPGGAIPGDLDGDGDVDLTDLATLLGDFGCTNNCAADIDGDGDTDLTDLSLLLSNFGS